MTAESRLDELTEKLMRIQAEVRELEELGAENAASFWRRQMGLVGEKILESTGWICPYCAGERDHVEECPLSGLPVREVVREQS